jgi:hypothetical protein
VHCKEIELGEMSELAEGARLEIACAATKWHRGFESLSLRHHNFSAIDPYHRLFYLPDITLRGEVLRLEGLVW